MAKSAPGIQNIRKHSEYYNNLFILTLLSNLTLQKSEKMHTEMFKITITFTKQNHV